MTTRLPTPQASTDLTFSVRGYVTDPKLIGYQVLTNYESTYWAPLVGNDAWRLYEVLRSFCHQGNNTCHPSINLLIAILGLKDRSVLIGRAKPKTVKGKAYAYPGLIQILQNHNLVIAEVTGEGPLMRYIFHVHLTPSLLTEEELGQLPEILREKHRELLDRCEAERKALEAKKKPPKLLMNDSNDALNDLASGKSTEVNRGIGNSNRGIGISNTPSWKFQYKQHPINNTQLTTDAREDHNNNSSGTSTKSDVVVAFSASKVAKEEAPTSNLSKSKKEEPPATSLVQAGFTTEPTYGRTAMVPLSIAPTVWLDSVRAAEPSTQTEENLGPTALDEANTKLDVSAKLLALGLADTVTKRLTSRYHAERIAEKIEFLAYLQEQAPEKVKNPRGWLRRAIEENYGPPDGFLTQAEREQHGIEAERQTQAAVVHAQVAQAREAEQAAQLETFRQQLHDQYGTTAEDLAFWEQAQAEFKFASIAHPELRTWLAGAEILNRIGTTVQIGIPQEGLFRQLGHPGTKKVIARALSQAAGRTVVPEFVCLAKPA
jgi:hypothetical protein